MARGEVRRRGWCGGWSQLEWTEVILVVGVRERRGGMGCQGVHRWGGVMGEGGSRREEQKGKEWRKKGQGRRRKEGAGRGRRGEETGEKKRGDRRESKGEARREGGGDGAEGLDGGGKRKNGRYAGRE